jgi:hypothetical protein
MAAWRRKAVEQFPTLRCELNNPAHSIYGLFFDLLPMVRDAHHAANEDVLRRIYDFAAWCLGQRAKDLRNAAGTSFYEHLFDCRDDWTSVIPWLSEKVVADCWGLWEARLSDAEIGELRALIADQAHAGTLSRAAPHL